MSLLNQESIQILNTAIVKTKEAQIDTSYEERLATICASSVMRALSVAIDHLAEEERISRDQSAIKIVETIRDLDKIWNDYVLMEGLGKLKHILKKDRQNPYNSSSSN